MRCELALAVIPRTHALAAEVDGRVPRCPSPPAAEATTPPPATKNPPPGDGPGPRTAPAQAAASSGSSLITTI
jgi:hypothetical protein